MIATFAQTGIERRGQRFEERFDRRVIGGYPRSRPESQCSGQLPRTPRAVFELLARPTQRPLRHLGLRPFGQPVGTGRGKRRVRASREAAFVVRFTAQ